MSNSVAATSSPGTPAVVNPQARRESSAASKNRGALANPARRGPVVLATKGSSDSRAPAKIAASCASTLQVPINVVSVVEPALQYGIPPEIVPGTLNIDAEAVASRASDVAETSGVQLGKDVRWHADVRLGYLPTEIADAARAIDASFVIVGASPGRSMRRISAGHKAGRILHRVNVPVLSVAPWMRGLPEHVLATIDLNPPSVYAALAALLIMPKGARMTLFHVVPPTFIFPFPTPEDELLKESVQKELRRVLAFLKPYAQGITLDQKVVSGDPTSEILKAAEQGEYDLVSMGTRSGSVMHRVLVGSIATEILHTSLCSVLASPPPPAATRFALELELKGTALAEDPREYAELMASFSKRNKGRIVSLEEDGSDVGAQVQAHGYVLNGAVYDPVDKRVDIMLSMPGAAGVHLSRSIPFVSSVAVVAKDGVDSALRVTYDHGQTLLLLERART